MAALDPALGVLSALTALPAALYYARAFGAAAVRPVRDAGGRISGLRGDARWTRTLFLFLGGTLLVAAVLGGLNMAFAQAVSQHAAFAPCWSRCCGRMRAKTPSVCCSFSS